MERKNLNKTVALSILAVHLALHIALGIKGWVKPFELFNLLLLAANVVVALLIIYGKGTLLLGAGAMIIIASHAVIGQKMAPDSLTSGTILMVNILILYVGIKIFEELSIEYFILFVASYFLLFYIFVRRMENAEALFLLSLMGLSATARNFKLLSYFWALVVAFTFCQPYAWHAAIIFFFMLKVIFSVRRQDSSTSTIVFLACGLVLVFFVLLPVLVLLLEDDPRNVVNILRDSEIRGAIYLTAITATISTAILALFCIPLAYAISRTRFFGKTLLLSLIDIPIIIPQSAAGIALLRVFGRQQYIGEMLFNAFGIRFDGTILGICLAQIFVAMPFIMKSALSAFEAVPPTLEQSARTLGSSPLGAFRRIALPLASRGVFIGAVLAWARAAGEFGAVLFIAPYPQTAPIAVYDRFTSVGIVQAAPLVTALLFFSIAMFFLLQVAVRMMPQTHRREAS